MKNILIGTMYLADKDCITNLRKLIDLGFESFNLFYWQKFNGVEPEKLAEEVFPIVQAAGVKISAISLFGNPLLDNEEGENTRSDFIRLIDSAKDFGCDIVSGFTGRLIDVPIPENIERFKAVWTPLAERAADKGVRIAWENCHMGGNWLTGDWNIAHNPDAWELMFDALPMDNVGLEWEPCHQLIQLIQPLPQIREWKKRLFHIHGKDATVRWDLISRHGIGGSECF
jgi:sugar phosphate isomerase/epimerase